MTRSLTNLEMHQEYSNTNSICAIKDTKLNYQAASKPLSKLLGFSQQQDLVGLNDSDLNCRASELAHIFHAYDRQVIERGDTLQLLGFNEYSDGWHFLLTTKKPIILLNGECTGLEIQTVDITELSILTTGLLLSDILSQKVKNKIAFNFCIKSTFDQIKLSRQESLCLFYFAHGYSTKEISKEINIAPSTVETYLNRIKEKLGCEKRSQLIEKMHQVNLATSLIG